MSKPKLLILLLCLSSLFLAWLVLTRQQTRVPPVSKVISGAIIPHHIVAKEFMEDLGHKLSVAPPKKIIIIGPNHDEVGIGHLLTDDPELSSGVINLDNPNVNKDHACFAPRSVLRQLLTNTSFSCLLVSSRTTPTETIAVAQAIKNYLGSEGVLIASVDFSHYLPLADATKNDLLTWDLISNFDSPGLLKLGSHYLDSPHTLTILFEYLRLINTPTFSKINHSNSALIYNSPDLASTTSYFEVVYYKIIK